MLRPAGRVVMRAPLLAILVLGLAGCFDPDVARLRDLQSANEWEEGSFVARGTVAAVSIQMFSDGERQLVQLRDPVLGCDGLIVPGLPVWHVGDRIEVTLHFVQRTFNGVPAIWAAELSCPGPGYARAIADVLDQVNLVRGQWFSPVEGDAHGGTYRYETTLGAPVDGQVLRLWSWAPGRVLDGPRAWMESSADLFVAVSDAVKDADLAPGFQLVQESPLAQETPGPLAFVDGGRMGQLDSGDVLHVRGLADGFYLLQVVPCGEDCHVQAFVVADGLRLSSSPWWN